MSVPNLSETFVPRNLAVPTYEHVSLGGGVRAFAFFACAAVSVIFMFLLMAVSTIPAGVLFIAEAVTLAIISTLVSGIRITAQWERAVILRFGSFHSVKGPGVIYVVPIIDYARFIDMRILTLNIPKQSVITKDNVPIEVDGVVFFKVEDAEKSIISIQDYRFAISQYAQNSLRDVLGGLSLDEVLSERERVQKEVYEHFKDKVKEWGMNVDSVRILDIQMPEDLKRVMSRQASAEREKRATIIKAEGDKLASVNLSEAAKIMLESKGAMELRTLQTIDGLGSSPSNTILLFPVELMQQLKSIIQHKENE